ncbi:potassium/sodium hyperpolarization-activated cyclic nucleotide-gated channel 2-like [Diorhabda carinulata]|uniref:potassium/sodium hyperpolarization-activated cyclic nucleotide-gated channel 2-like n=1 Tax=Diorhabda carinulata TaxID=1163345 RepID=UPI0025A2B2C5|nr:potassium/sodium hyperpolarization-activated cyclic nucleotide-gated channel 2-like [Diorhabda carinulata]
MGKGSTVEHACVLRRRKTMVALEPLPPTSGLWARISRKFYSLIILNMQSNQCKKFYNHPSFMRAELRRHVHSNFSHFVHPFSKLSSFVDKLFYILLLHRTFLIIYADKKPSGIFETCVIRDAIHIIIMITRFFTGYIDKKTKEVCLEPSRIARNYITSYFILDAYLAVEEYIYLTKLELWKIATNIISFFVYLLRFKSLNHVMDDYLNLLGTNNHSAFILYNTLLLTFILHGFSSLMYWVPTHIYRYNKNFPENSWINRKDLSFTEYNESTYIACFFIVISYFLGSTHFDLVSEPIEQLLLFVLTFSGRMCTLVVIARVLIYFGYSDVSESEYENMVFQLYNYMRTMKVPKEIQEVILERMKYTYQKKYFNENEILSTLTEQMKTELFIFGAKHLIAKCPPLQSLDRFEITKLFVHMKTHIFSPHEVIQNYDDVQPYIFFISSGMVAGYTNDAIQFLILGEGDVLGMIRSSPSEPPWYSSLFISVETTEVYSIHYKNLKLVTEAKQEHFTKYFRALLLERQGKHRTCKTYHKKANTVMTQLQKGELLEKPQLRHGYADM